MATKQKDLSRLNDALANEDWPLACVIIHKFKYEFNNLYDYCAEKNIEAGRITESQG